MRRATITLPDDLEAELDSFLEAHEAPPALTTVVQAALRRYLAEKRGEPLGGGGHDPTAGGVERPGRDRPYPIEPLEGDTSDIAEEPGAYGVGRGSHGSPPPAVRAAGTPRVTVDELPEVLGSLPRLSEAEADDLAADLQRARRELAQAAPSDPWNG